MGRRIAFVAAVALGASMLGSASMVAGQEKAAAPRDAAMGKGERPDAVLAKVVEAYRLLIYSAPQQCGDANCTVPITFTVVPVQDQNICIAKLPVSLQFTNTGSGPKTITWKLNTGGLLMEFPTKNGILVIDDAKNQINPDNARTDPLTYSANNKHSLKGSATYVPVILYRPAQDQPPGVCATGDPQIVNN